MHLIRADVDADHVGSPMLQQAVGEPPGGLADVHAAQTSHLKPGGFERPFELEPAP